MKALCVSLLAMALLACGKPPADELTQVKSTRHDVICASGYQGEVLRVVEEGDSGIRWITYTDTLGREVTLGENCTMTKLSDEAPVSKQNSQEVR